MAQGKFSHSKWGKQEPRKKGSDQSKLKIQQEKYQIR
jgi:hypothetical protein